MTPNFYSGVISKLCVENPCTLPQLESLLRTTELGDVPVISLPLFQTFSGMLSLVLLILSYNKPKGWHHMS